MGDNRKCVIVGKMYGTNINNFKPHTKVFHLELLFCFYIIMNIELNDTWYKIYIVTLKKKLFYFDTKLLIILLPFYNYIFATLNYMLYTSQ